MIERGCVAHRFHLHQRGQADGAGLERRARRAGRASHEPGTDGDHRRNHHRRHHGDGFAPIFLLSWLKPAGVLRTVETFGKVQIFPTDPALGAANTRSISA